MSQHKISLAAGAVTDADPAETIHIADIAGFDLSGLWVEPPKWTGEVMRETRRMLDDTDLQVLDVEVIMIEPGPPKADHFKLIDIGAEVGAKNVLIVSTDPDRANTMNCYEALCKHAESVGMRAVLEFMKFMAIATLDEALEVVQGVAHPAGGILIDTLHLDRVGYGPADIQKIPAELLPYAQLCDAPTMAPGTTTDELLTEALDGRLLPGEGVLPLNGVLDALPANIPLSLELRSKVLRETYPDPEQRAIRICEATRAFLENR